MAHKEKAIPGSLVWVWETLEVVRVWSESKPRSRRRHARCTALSLCGVCSVFRSLNFAFRQNASQHHDESRLMHHSESPSTIPACSFSNTGPDFGCWCVVSAHFRSEDFLTFPSIDSRVFRLNLPQRCHATGVRGRKLSAVPASSSSPH